MATTPQEVEVELGRSVSDLGSELTAAYARKQAVAATATAKDGERKLLSLEELRARMLEWLAGQQAVKDLICVKMNYCNNSQSKTVEFVISIADSVIMAHSVLLKEFPVPAVRVACYILKAGVLDELCDCKAS